MKRKQRGTTTHVEALDLELGVDDESVTSTSCAEAHLAHVHRSIELKKMNFSERKKGEHIVSYRKRVQQ